MITMKHFYTALGNKSFADQQKNINWSVVIEKGIHNCLDISKLQNLNDPTEDYCYKNNS